MRRRLTILGLLAACLLVLPFALAPPAALAADPQVVGSCSLPGYAVDVAVVGDLAYVTTYYGGAEGLQLVDVSNPAAPVVVGSCALPSPALGVAVAGSYAFVADEAGGLQVVDVRDSAAPVVVASCALPSDAADVVVVGSYAYVATEYDSLQVVDISDPTTPLVGTYRVWGNAVGVAVAENYAYTVSSWSPANLQVVDVSSPAAPVAVGSCALPSDAADVVVVGSYAYVAGFGGLRVVDISDPAAPVVVGSAGAAGGGVAVSGHLAYTVSSWSPANLQVIDVSDPAAPLVAGFCALPGAPQGVAVAGSYAFVADEAGGLQVVDVRPPQLTSVMPGHAMPGAAVVIAGSDLGSGGTVEFGSTVATTSAWSDTSITCTVPAGLAAGPTSITVTSGDGAASNALAFTIDGLALTGSAKPAVAAYKGLVTVKGELRDTLGALLPGFALVLQTSINGSTWSDLASVDSSTGAYSATMRIVRKTYFRWSFAGDATYPAAVSPKCSATCKASLTPLAVPSVVRRGVKYASFGYLRPQHAGGRAPITISFYRYSSGRWRPMMGGTWSGWDNVSGATKYGIWYRLGTNDAGRWRVRAMHRDADHVKTYSAWRYFVVR